MNYTIRRQQMVENQLRARGIFEEEILRAFLLVPRELFVPDELQELAYADRALPIWGGQTISQPYIVALQTQMLAPDENDTVLEIGSGSGYQAAVLSRLVKKVVSVEIIPELAELAAAHLQEVDAENVEVMCADGSDLPPELGQFDKMIVTAATPQIPANWVEHLRENGLLVLPEGRAHQMLQKYQKVNGRLELMEEDIAVRFVPLTGARG